MYKQTFIGFYLLIAILFSGGCASGPDLSGVDVKFKIVPFYKDIHSIPVDSVANYIPGLKAEYGSFLELYSQGVIQIGSVDAPEYAGYLKSFIEYEANRNVYDTCKVIYADVEPLRGELDQAFKHYRFYYPKAAIPDVYMHISGFNQSMVVDSGLVSISIEKYLGVNCKFYEWLSYPLYLRKKMIPQKIVPDVVRALAMTDYPLNDSVDDVAAHVIYEGKMAWFVKQIIPEINDTLLFDYSAKEMEWCKANEAAMWATVIENKHLFNNDRMVIQKYTGDAPFTTFFGQESPGHAGIYLGYRLIESYVKVNNVSLPDLMKMDNYHDILSKSNYRP